MIAAITAVFTEKPAQTLDPISTLCMLATRICKVFKEHRPAVCDNWLYFEENGYTRTFSKVSSNDLQILKSATIPFFTKCWNNSNADLVEIVKLAIQGIEQLRKMYDTEVDNSMDTCDVLKAQLTAWLPPVKPEENKPDPIKAQNSALIAEAFGLLQKGRANKKADAPDLPIITVLERLTLALQEAHITPNNDVEQIAIFTKDESAVKAKIDAIWTAEEIKFALVNLRKEEMDTLLKSLDHKKIAYLTALKTLEK
ncbi:MAG: hypothetical protein LLF94_08750 [Chlamydiales bacterium]|nr:hypothetical protein [Chlamydiales bacterium]